MNFKKSIIIITSLVLLVSFTTGCEKETVPENNGAESSQKESAIEKTKREVAENSAQGVIDAAKLRYTLSLLEDELVTSGNVIDLDVEVYSASSGTWSIDTGTGNVTIKDVVINNYTCNSINPENGRDIECKRNN